MAFVQIVCFVVKTLLVVRTCVRTIFIIYNKICSNHLSEMEWNFNPDGSDKTTQIHVHGNMYDRFLMYNCLQTIFKEIPMLITTH